MNNVGEERRGVKEEVGEEKGEEKNRRGIIEIRIPFQRTPGLLFHLH